MITVFIYPDATGAVLCTERTDGRHYRGTLEEVKRNFLLDMADRGLSSALFQFKNMKRAYNS